MFINILAIWVFSSCFFPKQINAQTLFYQDIFYGGVTAGGFSTGQGFGSGSFNLYIEPGSTIKKAYLFTYRQGYPPNVAFTINGTSYTFDTTNVLMQVNHKSIYASPSHLYFYDFTDSLKTNITSNFNVTIPSQTGLPINWGYWSIYIYIVYENPSLQKTATSLWVNDKDFLGNEFYTYKNLNPIDTTKPVSFAIYSDRMVDTNLTYSYNTYLNTNLLGRIGGADATSNLWSSAGVRGHFYYQNDTLFGLDDDTPDSLMGGTDGLADISTYLINNDTSFNFRFEHEQYPNNSAGNTSLHLADIITYSTPCDTFSTSISTTNDTICPWGSTQLQATGGSKYSWFGAFGGLNDTSIANPIASPPQTTTYICTITNDSGCVKTEQVKVWVDACVGINEKNNNAPLIELYPNPTNGSFTITSNKTINNISITNIVGTTVYQQNNIADNQLNLNLNLPNALYFISFKTANGTVVKKLVVR